MLDTPFTLPRGLTLENRLVKAAMTEALADERDLPSAALLTLYRRFGRSGAGLLITGNVGIDRDHPVRPGDVILDEDTPQEPLERWARAAKEGGAKVIVQLNHGGRQTQRMVNPRPLAPSAVPALKILKAFGPPRAATASEIERIIERFARAAERLAHAGFDGVQIHAAHGYLISQFLSPHTNLRTDDWGGSVYHRARLLLRIVREVRLRVPPRFAVAVKLNAADFSRGGFSEEDSLEVVRLLEREQLDFLEVSGGTYEKGASFGHGQVPSPREAYFLSFVERARAIASMPLLLTGGFRSGTAMREALASGAVDLIGLARPLALEPELPRRLLDGGDAHLAERRRWSWLRAIAPAAEMAFYSAQLRRIGDGQEPEPRLSPSWALVQTLVGDARRARARRTPSRPLLAPHALKS